MQVEVKKIWNGMVSVRDYLVAECLQKNEQLVIVFGGNTMTVSKDSMQQAKRDAVPIKSKFGGRSYYLVNFTWKPDNKIVGQEKLI